MNNCTHRQIKCLCCDITISQCRCFVADKKVEYNTCEPCKILKSKTHPGKELARFQKIEAAARNLVKNFSYRDESSHKAGCGIVPKLAYSIAVDRDCTCGLILLVRSLKALEEE
jgi:hypothetical protein